MPPPVDAPHQPGQGGHEILLQGVDELIRSSGFGQDQLAHRQTGLITCCSVGFGFVTALIAMAAARELLQHPLQTLCCRVIGAEFRLRFAMQRQSDLKGFEIAHRIAPGPGVLRFNVQRVFHCGPQLVLFAVITALLGITEGQMLRLDPPAPGEFLRWQVALLDHVQYLPFGFPKPCCGLFECQLHDNIWYVFNRLCLIDDKGVTKNFCASRKINTKKQGVKGARGQG